VDLVSAALEVSFLGLGHRVRGLVNVSGLKCSPYARAGLGLYALFIVGEGWACEFYLPVLSWVVSCPIDGPPSM
jgi:hypothetical protein